MNIKDVDSRIARKLASIRKPFRGRLRGVANTKPGITLVSGIGLAGEVVLDNELFQHFGFSSCPPEGSQFIVLPLGGKTSQGVIIATGNSTYRLKNQKPGESAIHNHRGDYVYIKDDGSIDIKSSLKVTVHSPLVEVPDGDVVAGPSRVSLLYHKHSGVQTGSGQTGVPV